jgi:oligosaccharide repeat unit polymerase
MTGQRSLGAIIATALALATFAGWLAIPHARGLDPLVVVLLWLNVALILTGLGAEVGRRPYSLHLMHLISMFLFLGAASLLQYSRGVLGVPGPIITVQPQILPSVAATTFWMIGYLSAYELRRLLSARPRKGFLSRELNFTRIFLLSQMAIVCLVFLAAAGMLGVTTRGASEAAIADFSETAGAGRLGGSLYIVISNLARALPPVALLACLLVLFRHPRKAGPIVFLFVAVIGTGTLLLNNPFAASRMFFTCSLIAFLTPFFLRRFKTGWLLVVVILIGLAILPALGSATTRSAIELEEVLGSLEVSSPLWYLAANSDVDSLGMTALTQKWIDMHGHRWGMQILGALLFWVPRVFWPGKPVGTGTMVTEDLGFDFTNLAPPITAEALVNFGLIGVLVMGALFGLALAALDGAYWAPGREGIASSHRIIDAIYPFWLGCIVFITRGDLFPSTAFTTSFTVWVLPLGLGLAAARSAEGDRHPRSPPRRGPPGTPAATGRGGLVAASAGERDGTAR